MTTSTSGQPRRTTLLPFLRSELAPRPGRMRAVWRITVGCTLIVVLGMVFQIPLPAYMAYLVFLVSREETAATFTTGLGAAVATTVAVALSFLFYLLDAGEPALRIPLLALSTFIAMFFARTSTLGPIVFLAGFILVLSQTLIDDVPSVEFLTRFLLWLWFVLVLPAFVTVFIDLLWGEDPVALLRARVDALLRETVKTLEGKPHADLTELQNEAVRSIELCAHAGMWDKKVKAKSQTDLGLFEGLATLLSLLKILPGQTPLAVRLPLAEAIDACRVAILTNTAPALSHCVVDEDVISSLEPADHVIVAAIVHTSNRILQGAAVRLSEVPAPRPAKRLFAPDAFTNRGYVQFALKTTLAVTLAYITYTLLDWPGIRTAVTTCFFVALGSMAETMHKLSLRLTGAIVGGAVAGLCIVYLLPHMTDIGQLSLLIAVMSALSAWVATSSDRLAYAGMQMAFAFYLGILHDYAPATDLTVLRDRVAGILLGNILMSVIFSTLWPVSAAQLVRSSMARTLDLLAKLVSTPGARTRFADLAVIQELLRARKLASLNIFEESFLSAHATATPAEGMTLAQLDRLASAVFVMQEQSAAEEGDAALVQEREAVASWLAEAASRLKSGRGAPLWLGPGGDARAVRDRTGRDDAMAQLRAEIADVAPAR